MTEKNNKYLDLIVYVIGFVLIIITPFFARLISPLFDWAGYGAMRKFFNELFTSIIWFVEILILAIVYKKKFKQNIVMNPEVKGEELPYKRMAVITAIVVVCILVISAQIGFQVKPFYDLGEKFNGYDLINNVGIFVRNVIKCMWIVIMAKAMQSFCEQLIGSKNSKIPFAGIVLMLTVGIYDIITGVNNLAVTYLLLYAVYGWLYLLTNKNMIKTYLLVVFIFLF